jgi:hypothetical protein
LLEVIHDSSLAMICWMRSKPETLPPMDSAYLETKLVMKMVRWSFTLLVVRIGFNIDSLSLVKVGLEPVLQCCGVPGSLRPGWRFVRPEDQVKFLKVRYGTFLNLSKTPHPTVVWCCGLQDCYAQLRA